MPDAMSDMLAEIYGERVFWNKPARPPNTNGIRMDRDETCDWQALCAKALDEIARLRVEIAARNAALDKTAEALTTTLRYIMEQNLSGYSASTR